MSKESDKMKTDTHCTIRVLITTRRFASRQTRGNVGHSILPTDGFPLIFITTAVWIAIRKWYIYVRVHWVHSRDTWWETCQREDRDEVRRTEGRKERVKMIQKKGKRRRKNRKAARGEMVGNDEASAEGREMKKEKASGPENSYPKENWWEFCACYWCVSLFKLLDTVRDKLCQRPQALALGQIKYQ